MLESLKGSLNFLSMSLLVKKSDERQDPELKLNLDITKRKKLEILTVEHQISELMKDEEVFYDKLIEKQFAMNNISLKIGQKLRENYEVLLDCKKNMIPLVFERGSLNDILYLPERDAFVFDLLRFRLEKIDVNFDYLSEELQNANGDEMCEKLCRKFNEIEAELKLFPAPEGNLAEKINFFSTKLMESNATLPALKIMVDQDEVEFSLIKKLRFDKFLDCLDDLNDSVQHTYIQLKNNTTSKAFFSIVNEDDPFRDGIKLSFWNNPQMGENKDEVFLQTLSFLIAAIRWDLDYTYLLLTIYLHHVLDSKDKDLPSSVTLQNTSNHNPYISTNASSQMKESSSLLSSHRVLNFATTVITQSFRE